MCGCEGGGDGVWQRIRRSRRYHPGHSGGACCSNTIVAVYSPILSCCCCCYSYPFDLCVLAVVVCFFSFLFLLVGIRSARAVFLSRLNGSGILIQPKKARDNHGKKERKTTSDNNTRHEGDGAGAQRRSGRAGLELALEKKSLNQCMGAERYLCSVVHCVYHWSNSIWHRCIANSYQNRKCATSAPYQWQ